MILNAMLKSVMPCLRLNICLQLSVTIFAIFCSDLASCDVECGNFHQAESCKKCVENESPMIKRLMPYSWCGGECKWEPVTGLCIGKHTKIMIVKDQSSTISKINIILIKYPLISGL